jgi:ABC-type glycerol-3-phosphate transport system substrate-binding protein
VWLPPEFDPGAGTPAASLLEARLASFAERHPGVRVSVRVKSLEGPGGIMASLEAASTAAPLALPDVAALTRGMLETAAQNGLAFPIDNYMAAPVDEDWYGYAQDMGRYQDSFYGLPFAGDALVTVYRPSAISQPPADWNNALRLNEIMALPAADPNALAALAWYLSMGGALQGEAGNPTLAEAELEAVLGFFEDGQASGLLPFWLTQYESDALSWQAFRERQAQLSITWLSRYLQDASGDSAASPMPTPDGTPFTLAGGWVWTLTADESSRSAIAVELIEYLSASESLGQWTIAAGYLPPRPSALDAWPQNGRQALASQISPSAQLLPQRSLLEALGPVLSEAVVAVLKQESDAGSAAAAVIEQLTAQ